MCHTWKQIIQCVDCGSCVSYNRFALPLDSILCFRPEATPRGWLDVKIQGLTRHDVFVLLSANSVWPYAVDWTLKSRTYSSCVCSSVSQQCVTVCGRLDVNIQGLTRHNVFFLLSAISVWPYAVDWKLKSRDLLVMCLFFCQPTACDRMRLTGR